MSGSLSEVPGFVADAYRVVEPPFKPEDIQLGSYTFLPWVRTGVAAAAGDPLPGELRARLTVAVPVQAAGRLDAVVTQSLSVRGPGDVLGIDARQVIRRYPHPGTAQAEDTFLAHVEFDRPELPWLVSPEPPGTPGPDRLTPWVVLVVVTRGRYDWTPGRGGLPPSVSVAKGELQSLDDSWAWAHAQVLGGVVGPVTVRDRLRAGHAPANLSRVVCPRRLVPGNDYLACLVPRYDAGVQAGLGSTTPGTLAKAWLRLDDGSDADERMTLPVYDSWRFSTAATAGDFESLAELLHGLPAPWQLGRRVTDTSRPGGGLPDLAVGAAGGLQTVRGPLVSPQAPRADSADPVEQAAAAAEDASWATGPGTETELLRGLLNRPDEVAHAPGALSEAERPLVGPEVYARFHAAQTRVDSGRDGDWFGQLNLAPANRVAAGLGTRVVQHDQERLMQSAWAQVGDVDAANRRLRLAQAARVLGGSVHARHLGPLGLAPLMQVTRRAHSRLLAEPALTVAARLADSSTADAAATAAFRRATRPLGPLTRYATGRTGEIALALAAGDTARDHQRPYTDPDGVSAVSPAAAAVLDPTRVAPALGVDPTAVVEALLTQGATLTAVPSVPDALTPAEVASATAPAGLSLSDLAGRAVLERVRRTLPDQPAPDPVRVVAALALLGGLQRAGGSVAKDAAAVASHLTQVLPAQVPPDPVLGKGFAAASEVSPKDALSALGPVAGDLVAPDWPGTPVRPALDVAASDLLARLDPAVNATARVRARLGPLPGWLPADWFDDGLVQPVMAAPVFTRPMYQALNDYSTDWLLPGLAHFAQPDLVTALVTNAVFTEGFLAGLSHEMARELLWRGYPTDRRGTYFRRFWSPTKDELAQDLHRFTPTPLGSHLVATMNGRVVLLVKGELVRRYPDALVLAMLAHDQDDLGRPLFSDPVAQPATAATVLFHGHLAPDMVLVGFDLTVPDIEAAMTPPPGPPTKPGWWFLVAEHPTAPRFGLLEPPHAGTLDRDTLCWDDLPTRLGCLDATRTLAVPESDAAGAAVTTFGRDAASGAHLLLRDPVRAAFDAMTLLGPTQPVHP